jgi:hypothetical protein
MIVYNSRDRQNKPYVRVELSADGKTYHVGAAQNSKPEIITRAYQVWEVPSNLVKTTGDLAEVVHEFAKHCRIDTQCDLSLKVRDIFHLHIGQEVMPPETA